MKLKKVLTIVLALVLLICSLPLGAFTVSAAGYNSAAAVNYAAQHWNDGQGLCAEFVSNCLSAGGCSAWSVWVADLWTYLNNGGWGTGHTLTKSGSYINSYQNSGKLSAGDPIFYYCNSCGSWTHVVLCSGFNSSGNALAYGHNGAWNNEQYLGGYYDGHGHSGSAITVYSFHMTQGAQGNISLSFPTNGVTEVGENYFKLYFETSNPGTTVTTAGIRIRESNSSSWYTHTENIPSNIGNVSLLKTNYVVGSGQEINYTIQPGTTYVYQAYAIADGKTYYSAEVTFTTGGQKPHSHSYVTYYKTAHPHELYKKCSCGDEYYTGSNKNVSSCTICNPIDASKTTATLSSSNFFYTGRLIEPIVYVKDSNGNSLVENKDFTVKYPGNTIELGTYKATVTFIGNYTGTKTLTYKINPANASRTTATLSATSFTYSGKFTAPAVKIKNSVGNVLVNGRDYTLSTTPLDRRNAGTYKVKITYKGNYTGTKTLTYKINPLNASQTTVKLSASGYTYSGKHSAPAVTIKDKNGNKLIRGTDYTLTYPRVSKEVGTYAIKITYKGNYSGTKTVYYKINPPVVHISKVISGKRMLTVNIARNYIQTTGYQIQYSTSKNFTSASTRTVNNNRVSAVVLNNLKANTGYYVRIRSYRTINRVNYYSNWSTAKYMKTK